MKRIGVLTGGGDAPGLNAAIRAVVKTAHKFGYQVLGIKDGWKGLLEFSRPTEDETAFEPIEDLIMFLTDKDVSGILDKGGTILGSSRTNPTKEENGLEKIIENIKKLKIDALIPIGGEDTLSVAVKLNELGIPVVGIPKTIDNDVGGTDYSIGFWTAVQIGIDALDRLHSTAEAHHRIMILEVMGRHFGWIATYAGLAGGADYILIPEEIVNIDEVCNSIERRYQRGKKFSLIVVSEGANLGKGLTTINGDLDAFGHVKLGGVGEILAKIIKERTGLDTRSTNLGHIQRGGTPCPFDRILASRLGVKTVELVKQKKFGRMVALRGNRIVSLPIEEALQQKPVIKSDVYKVAKVFFS